MNTECDHSVRLACPSLQCVCCCVTFIIKSDHMTHSVSELVLSSLHNCDHFSVISDVKNNAYSL